MNRSKVEERKGEYIGFKEGIRLEIMGDGAVVEAVCWRRGGDSFGRDRGFNSETNR